MALKLWGAADTGEIKCGGKGCVDVIYHRDTEPKLFWFTVGENVLFGALSLVGGVFYSLAVIRFPEIAPNSKASDRDEELPGKK